IFMMIRQIGKPYKTLSSIKFSCYNADEIRQLSVKRVTNPHSLDALLNPTEGGLYDAAYGASSRDELCSTCGKGSVQCTGHMGHIELPLPVYHPLFFKTLIYLLRGSCMKCQKLLIPRQKIFLMTMQLQALEKGMVQTVYKLKEAENEAVGISVYEKSNDDVATMQEIQEHLERVLLKHYDDIANYKIESNAEGMKSNHGKLDFLLIVEIYRGLFFLPSHKNFFSILNSVSFIVIVISLAGVRLLTSGASTTAEYTAWRSWRKPEKVFFKLPTLLKSNDFRANCAVNPALINLCFATILLQEASQSYMTPSSVQNHISALWNNEKDILSMIFVAMADAAGTMDNNSDTTSAVDVLFLSVLSVPPSRFRPIGCVNDRHFESPQTTSYSKVRLSLRTVITKQVSGCSFTQLLQIMDLLSSIPGKTLSEKLENAWHRLQQHINCLMDSDLDRLTVNGGDKIPGIKQLLEKKDGLFRKHMMGKRVNYAARSVISPDPYIATNEIGLPMVFATKLTYPCPVTPWNLKMLRQAVMNGPLKHPGATHVVSEGRTVLLSATDQSQRESVAKQLTASDTHVKTNTNFETPKTVLRHIQTGDVMLLNRQPTLHKGSIMAHRVRVLPGEKTLRMHYANCKSYNADFDGDEMNAHFQTELCRSEAYQLMSTDRQYLSGKDGKPLSCLIQDHMVAGVNISIRGRFFTREQYQQLTYNALMHLPYKVKLLTPAILKPQPLWSGKQVFSTIFMNITPNGLPRINLTGKSKIGPKNWQNAPPRNAVVAPIDNGDMCESQVIIRDGELLCGVLDKAHYGATEHGLVHATYELYSGEISGRLLTCLARLFTAFLQFYRGFTLGVEDILVKDWANKSRTDVVVDTKDNGMAAVAKTLNVKRKENTEATKITVNKGEDKLAAVDHAMKTVSNDVNDKIAKCCTGNGLLKTFPTNNLQLMVISGAKGGAVNCMQISCLLGQIELEGRRPPLMPSGRSAPSFMPYDTTIRAGGFISQRFLTGIRPQEYFYHCMAGREGLVDTAVKTSRSGYLQRCLIKHLEGLLLSYDMTVRDSDGSVVQFLYGEDGIDINKTSYLNQQQYDFVVKNYDVTKQLPDVDTFESSAYGRSITRKWSKFDKLRKKRNKRLRKTQEGRTSGFLNFSVQCKSGNLSEIKNQWMKLDIEGRAKYLDKTSKLRLPDTIISQYRPDIYFGSTSDHFHDEMKKYIKQNPLNLPANDTTNSLPLESLLKMRYQRSLCQPGESVGLLAAQSIGEPSTQMTLNTFHFAGRGEMNVTLGIPRLREILMVASKQIKTPQITVPVKEGRQKRAKRLCKELTKVLLSQVLHKFTVDERLVVGSGDIGDRYRRCVVTIQLLPERQFGKEMAMSRDTVLRHIEKNFFRALLFAITKQLKKRESEVLQIDQRVARETVRRAKNADGEDASRDAETFEAEKNADDDDVDEEAGFDDGDAAAEGQRRKKREEVDYEEQDDELPDENDNSTMIEPDEDSRDSAPPMMEEQDTEATHEIDEAAVSFRIRAVKNLGHGNISIEDYEFDAASSGWCRVTFLMPLTSVHVDVVSLVRSEACQSAVRQVPGISRCILVPVQGQACVDAGAVNLVTEGINFYKIFENEDSLDVNRLYSNCVHSVAQIYGVEAARRVVVKEIANVFAVYGIEVDSRHLSLIGDYMCYEGVYKPFNRLAIASCVSPLQQMSFETTMKFLNSAALHGSLDRLQSPSARIVAGQVVKGGTGNFSLL
uniref:DNA-directed RNA polymerase subunit n=1 Tax=Ciona savignyi TaxID=51511 RepID=H2Z3P3_CIOSA